MPIMKRTRVILAVLAVSTAAYAADDKPSPSPTGSPGAASSALKDDKDKLSYAIGTDIGRTLLRLQVEFSQGALTQGILDILNKKPTAMTEEELTQTMQGFQQNLAQKQEQDMAKKQANMKTAAEKNKTTGKQFLDDNGKKQDVTTLADGLQYNILQAVCQRGYVLFLSIVVEKLFAGGFVLLGCCFHVRLLLSHLLFLFLRQVLLEALHCLSEFLFGHSSRLLV